MNPKKCSSYLSVFVFCCCLLIVPKPTEAEPGLSTNTNPWGFTEIDLSDYEGCGSDSELERYLLAEPSALVSCAVNNPNLRANECCERGDNFFIRMRASAHCTWDGGQHTFPCNIKICKDRFEGDTCDGMEELCIEGAKGQVKRATGQDATCEITEGCEATTELCPGMSFGGECGIGDTGIGCEVADW